MSLFMTAKEVEDMTGYKQKAAQVRWLQQNGIRHTVRADGWPRVPNAVFSAPPQSSRTEPDFKAIRRAG